MVIEVIISAIDSFFQWVCSGTHFWSPDMCWFILIFITAFGLLKLFSMILCWIFPCLKMSEEDCDVYHGIQSDDRMTPEQYMEMMARDHPREFESLCARAAEQEQ